jgi:hypothetical protein
VILTEEEFPGDEPEVDGGMSDSTDTFFFLLLGPLGIAR